MKCVALNCKTDISAYNFDNIEIDDYWNKSTDKEARMHSIHNYPAKFPAFIVNKAIEYAMPYLNNKITCISDVFCGCGTVALESRIKGINFWGCDINPVATLIAKTKSELYRIDTLQSTKKQLFERIDIELAKNEKITNDNERIQYWFDEDNIRKIAVIKTCIDELPKNKYRRAFLCLLSSVLKASSKWLTKSIKPQIDPNKTPVDPIMAFKSAVSKFVSIVENEQKTNAAKITIENCNFISKKKFPKVDLIISSPPYVTSYEYADLHQLSSLWLGYVNDYTELRKGTIGSVYNSENYYFEIMDLNTTASNVVQALYKTKTIGNAKTKSVARYFVDMQTASRNCFKMLNDNGIACFVIGDTEYKGVKIQNAKHLSEALLEAGFKCVKVSKRRISNKTLSPYRDEAGKFSSDENNREVYHEEYVIIAHKKEIKNEAVQFDEHWNRN